MKADDPEVRRQLGRAIAAARGSRSQDWLAEELGVHQTTVSDWEQGNTAPRLGRLPAIEEALGMREGALRSILMGEPVGPDDDDPVMIAFRGLRRDLTDEEIQRLIGYGEGLREARRREQ